MDFEIQLDAISSGWDGERFWCHPRPGVLPTDNGPAVIVTMQKAFLGASDYFYPLNDMRTDDLGATWIGPTEHKALGRRVLPDGREVAMSDVTPGWHDASGSFLGIGHTVVYDGLHIPSVRRRHTAYSRYDASNRTWSEWRTVEMPGRPEFANAGAGSVQWLEESDGTLLVPIYFKRPEEKRSAVTVMRCAFDGETLRYLEHGSAHTVAVERGMAEPSITRFDGRYWMTIRNDERGYVTSSLDGMQWSEPVPWTFDDGADLGNYNTQQHWLTHSGGLYLVYTRRGADNDNVFRHRAPLFMAKVIADPEQPAVVRESERILVPNKGARLGNFGVVNVTSGESWVTTAEWMRHAGCERYGSDGRVYVARVKWSEPNLLV